MLASRWEDTASWVCLVEQLPGASSRTQRSRSGAGDLTVEGNITTIMAARMEGVNMAGATIAEEVGGGSRVW